LPWSALASEEGKAYFIGYNNAPHRAHGTDIQAARKSMDNGLAKHVAAARTRYAAKIEPKTIAGVYTEDFAPTAGVTPQNQDRLLINLHGGGFTVGARTGGQAESIPISAVGRIKVISIDYRMAPEHQFPAASEDVAKVYRELLKQYGPDHIGIYGCSAGGILTAESIAWFDKEGLPQPGAIGVFCASLVPFFGDSGYRAVRLGSLYDRQPGTGWAGMAPYFGHTDFEREPLAALGISPPLLKKFPPTLFVTGTRAPELSAAAHSQLLLLKAGVDARISVWDAMDHGFMYNSDLSESREEYEVVTDFFTAQLGNKHRQSKTDAR
jgi:epsilon-lactone hydrolase